jgi:hypothetical protein
VYKVDIDPEARDQIGALPAEVLIALAEVMAMLELAPWDGLPHHKDNPDGALRGTVSRSVFLARHAGLRSGGMGTVSDDI